MMIRFLASLFGSLLGLALWYTIVWAWKTLRQKHTCVHCGVSSFHPYRNGYCPGCGRQRS